MYIVNLCLLHARYTCRGEVRSSGGTVDIAADRTIQAGQSDQANWSGRSQESFKSGIQRNFVCVFLDKVIKLGLEIVV